MDILTSFVVTIDRYGTEYMHRVTGITIMPNNQVLYNCDGVLYDDVVIDYPIELTRIPGYRYLYERVNI